LLVWELSLLMTLIFLLEFGNHNPLLLPVFHKPLRYVSGEMRQVVSII